MSPFSDLAPVILSVSSQDPTGSTGIQADIETALSLGVHCCTVITALCARDTRQAVDIRPTDTALMIEQCRAILEDMPVAAIKLGHFCHTEQIEAAHSILRDYPQLPVVLDPVANTALPESDSRTDIDPPERLFHALQTLLLPQASIVTPDIVEAHHLARQADTLDACGQEILAFGCDNVLITGARRSSDCVENRLYRQRRPARCYQWPRLGVFSHGAGATLSAALTAYLAHGLLLADAVEQSQQFTWQCLSASRSLGRGRSLPNRLYWADRTEGGGHRH